MSKTTKEFQIEEVLGNGRTLIIRAVEPDSKVVYSADDYHLSRSALYLRFLTPERELNEKELAYFTDSEFFHHVALLAAFEEDGKTIPAGVARYVMPNNVELGRKAELAFAVGQEYKDLGIEAILLKHLSRLAKDEGLQAFTAAVSADSNQGMLEALRQIDQGMISMHDCGVCNLLLPLQ